MDVTPLSRDVKFESEIVHMHTCAQCKSQLASQRSPNSLTVTICFIQVYIASRVLSNRNPSFSGGKCLSDLSYQWPCDHSYFLSMILGYCCDNMSLPVVYPTLSTVYHHNALDDTYYRTHTLMRNVTSAFFCSRS